jgi:hypothetical protein
MATPVETPQPSAPTGGPESSTPAPEGQQPAGGAPVATETPSGAPDIPVETSGWGQQAAPAPDPAPDTDSGAPETPADPAATPSPQGQPDTQQVEDLPDWAQKIIKDARDDAAKARVNAKQAAADEARKQMAQDIGKALGIITDDTPPEEQLNPDQLRDLLQGERTTARQARVELAVFKAAQQPDVSFNAAALLDSRAFLDAIKDVDPTDTEALTLKIAETVQANPWLAVAAPQPSADPDPVEQPPAAAPVAPAPVAPAAPVVPPSGGQFAGGPGAQPQDLTTMSIDDFRRLRRNRSTS